MPINASQLALGTNYQLEAYNEADPVDQISTEHPTAKFFIGKKQESTGGNAYFNEKVRFSHASNYQNYYGDDQVTFNRKDTVRLAKFPWFNFHDGFGVNEDELAQNGIMFAAEDTSAIPSADEKVAIVDLMRENYATLKMGAQEGFALELLQDGSANSKSLVGLDALISTTPTTGTVGGIDAAVATYWRNNASLAIAATAGLLTTRMEQMWRACQRYGKMAPDTIRVGQTFLDAYRAEFTSTIIRQAQTAGRALSAADVAIDDLHFHGIPVVWDPDFEALDTLLGAITYPWTKRCYFIQSKAIKLRPLKGHWMVNRKPPRMYDRYVYYFAITSKYRLTINQRNCHAVLSCA